MKNYKSTILQITKKIFHMTREKHKKGVSLDFNH